MDCWHWKPFQGTASFARVGESQTLFINRSLTKTPSGRFGVYGGEGLVSDPSIPHLSLNGQYGLVETEELASALGLQSSPPPSQSILLLRAYEKWGNLISEHLHGRFSFVVWDDRERQLFATRDHLGTLPFVYRVTGTEVEFAGDMQTMIEGFGVERKLNPQTLASCRKLWGFSVAPGETFFQGIFSLPPGHSLTASERGVSLNRYWYPSIRPELIPRTEEEVYARTAFLVDRAVSRLVRDRKGVGLMCSGGLDSSVLAVVAANCLRKLNRPLLAVGAVNEYPQIADESNFMAELSRVDNIQMERVSAPGRGPFDSIENVDAFHTSCIRYSRQFLDKALAETAASQGADIILSGNYGEATISSSPVPYMLECAAHLRGVTLARELRAASQRTKHPMWRLFGGELWRHVRPRPQLESVFLNRAFVQSNPVNEFERRALWPDTRKTKLKQVREMLGCDALLSTRPPDLVFAPVRPFEDPELLEFCLALPAKFKARDGVSRYLLRRSFAHMLPPSIAQRKDKLPFSPDYSVRYNAQLGRAVQFVQSIRKSDPVRDIVDVGKLETHLQPMEPSMARLNSPAVSSVPRSIYLINFLRHFPAFRA